MAATYEIIDEPRPGALSRFTVNPFWPLLSSMVGGAFFGWMWFFLNGVALGSPTRRQELLITILGFLAYFVAMFSMIFLVQSDSIAWLSHDYTRILLVAIGLIPSYWLFLKQSVAFELYQYFGGVEFNGLPGLVLAFFVGTKMQIAVVELVIVGVSPWI